MSKKSAGVLKRRRIRRALKMTHEIGKLGKRAMRHLYGDGVKGRGKFVAGNETKYDDQGPYVGP